MGREPFLELCELLMPGDPGLVEEVQLALDDPATYLRRFERRLDQRGIRRPVPDLAWIVF